MVKRVGLYELEEWTSGGMSRAYKGRRAGRLYFVKAVDVRDVEALRILQNEYQLLSTLSHPALPRIHAWLEEDGTAYLIEDFVAGSTLDRRSWSEEEVVSFALQLCDLLGYLHSRTPPVIYRDLKPENILCGPRGRISLIDFGLARTYKPGQARDTVPLGTPRTASPEHFSGQTDARSDVYSLGATLHELLRPPGVVPQLFTYAPLRTLNPAISGKLEAVVARCTARLPKDRFQSARDLAQALKGEAPLVPLSAKRSPRVSGHTRVQFTRQLAMLFQGGLPLVQCVETLARQTDDPAFAAILREIATRMQAGVPLSACLASYPELFPAQYPVLCRVGEECGGLVSSLSHLADWGERQNRLVRQVRAALAYPTFVLTLTLILTGLMCQFVLPAFVPIFAESGMRLPWLTSLLVELSVLLRKPGFWLAAAGLLLFFHDSWRIGRSRLEQTMIRTPVLGPVLRMVYVMRFSASFHMLLRGGVRLDDCLTHSCAASGYAPLAGISADMSARVQQGGNLVDALALCPEVFHQTELNMVGAGEESARLEVFLGHLGRICGEELEYRLSVLTSTLEPALMAFLAVTVGGVVLAMFLPLYSFLNQI